MMTMEALLKTADEIDECARRLATADLAQAISRLEDYDPRAIVLTMTSSVPYGFCLKEYFKTRYPDTETPAFLTVNVKSLRVAADSRERTAEFPERTAEFRYNVDTMEAKLRMTGIREGNIVVFDELTFWDFRRHLPYDSPLVHTTLELALEITEQAAQRVGTSNVFPFGLSGDCAEDYHSFDFHHSFHLGRPNFYEVDAARQVRRKTLHGYDLKKAHEDLSIWKRVGQYLAHDMSERCPYQEMRGR